MLNKHGNILVVDDDENILFAANMILSSHFKQIITQLNPKKVLEEFAKTDFDVVILDMNFHPGDTSGKVRSIPSQNNQKGISGHSGDYEYGLWRYKKLP